MPPTTSCPRCGRPSPANVTFCASCGSNLPSTWSGKGWKLFFGALAVFAGLLWISVLYTQPGSPARLAGGSQPQALLAGGSTPNAAQVAQAEPPPSLTLTSAQHLSEARRALADGYKPSKDAQKSQWGEVAAAKWHLKAITSSAPEYREAQDLLKEVARRERQIELARKQPEKEQDSDEAAEADADGEDDSSDERSPAVTTSSSPAYASPPSSTPTRASPPASTAGTGGSSSSDYYTNGRGVQVRRPTPSEGGPPAGATAQCRDGSYSFSQSRRGTCSHHGGVSRWL
jgi:hypothetical protein